MKSIFKYLLGALILTAGIFTVSYVQYRFDQSDVKHAVGAVRQARPWGANGPTLESALAKKYSLPVEHISWVPEIESKLQGTVRVKALLPQGGEELAWEVDLVRFSVKPLTPGAEGLAQGSP